MQKDRDVIVLRSTFTKPFLLFLGCLLFVAGGIWVAQENSFGYVAAAFFGLGIPVALIQMMPGSSWLRLTPEGLLFCSLYRQQGPIAWRDIDRFFVVEMQIGLNRQRMIGFNYTPDFDRSTLLRKINSAVSSCEASLPDNYGKSPEELVQLLEEYRMKFTLQEFA